VVQAILTPLFGVVVMFAGLGFLVAPAPAGAAPPAQGWTTTQAPLPADAGTNPRVYTASTTCPAANACVLVGWYDDAAGHAWGLIEQQNGTTWTDTEAPQPSNAGSGANQGLWLGSSACGFADPCRAVSCPTTTFCVAVGGYNDTAGHEEPLVETLSNGSWSASAGPLPGDAATDLGPTLPNANLYSVSCTSTTSCVAVGTYRTTSNTYVGLIATLSGSTWSVIAAPLPADATTTTSQYPPRLSGVSCASAAFCVASGTYPTASSSDTALLEVFSNGSWAPVVAPQPSNSGGATSFLNQVVCPSASSCTSVGVYQSNTSVYTGLIESWNGTAWSAIAAPVPSDAAADPFSSLAAVSCASPISCVAVGQYQGTGSTDLALVETLSNGIWTGSRAPTPAGAAANPESYLWEVSCPTPAFCMAAGEYYTGSTYMASVITLSGGTWSAQVTPTPGNFSSAGYSRTVACYSPVACVIAGPYDDASNNGLAFLDTWTGAQGYWLDASDGGIFTYPNNTFYGSTGALRLNKPMVGMAATPDAQGYWLVASDGGIFSYGDALFHGSRGGQHLNMPIVGMATTPTGNGYWLVASDGGIFSYGDAQFYGSTGNLVLNKPVVGMASTPDGKGYWLVASDGGIFSYGDAAFYGSTGSIKLNKPVVGMAARPTGLGYWLVASDGGIFSYGDAAFYGSTGSIVLNKPVVGMASSPSGKGYWFVASDGGVFNYGDAPFEGSTGAMHLNAPVVGMAGG
jgi:hypothetical protein